MSDHTEQPIAQDLPDDDYDPVMTPRGALVALLVLMFVSTLVDVGAGLSRRGEPVLWSLLTGLLSSFLGFYWFRLDRELPTEPRQQLVVHRRVHERRDHRLQSLRSCRGELQHRLLPGPPQ